MLDKLPEVDPHWWSTERADYLMGQLKEIAATCPFVSDVRGKGLMFALDFARPKEGLKLKLAWDALHKLNIGVFGQMVIIPLLQKHRTAGDIDQPAVRRPVQG